MATLAVTNTFSAGTTIVAADVNQNNDDIEAFINTTPGVVQNSIVDVLGDLIVATAADAVGRLAAGTNNHVLTADSTVSAHGLKWAAVPAPTTITVADTTDATCFVGLFESATGDLAPKTDVPLIYNASTGSLEATVFTGPLTGAVTGNADTATTAGTVTTAAQGAITSVGSLTGLTVAGNLTVTGTTTNHLTVPGDNGDAAIAPALGDENNYIRTTHATALVTLPQHSVQAFAVGTVIYYERFGTGTLTFAAGTGVTELTSKDSTKTCADRYTVVAAIKTDDNKWALIGNIG